jgi:hypothetical protein
MATDARLTSDRDIELDQTGDIATVVGESNVDVQHANALFRAGETIEHSLATPEAMEDLRVAVRNELIALPYVTRIRRLEIDERDRRTLTVTVATDAVTEPVTEEVDL